MTKNKTILCIIHNVMRKAYKLKNKRTFYSPGNICVASYNYFELLILPSQHKTNNYFYWWIIIILWYRKNETEVWYVQADFYYRSKNKAIDLYMNVVEQTGRNMQKYNILPHTHCIIIIIHLFDDQHLNFHNIIIDETKNKFFVMKNILDELW